MPPVGLKHRITGYQWMGVFLLLMLALIWATGFNGLYGQDSYEYLRYTKLLLIFFKTGANPGDYFWPVFYPLLGSILSFVFTPSFSLQLISILSLLVSAIYLEKILRFIFITTKAACRLYIIIFFLLSPYVLRSSLVVMSDSLCVFLTIAAYYHFLLYYKLVQNKHLIAFAFFSISAVMSRYAAAIILIPPAVAVLFVFSKHFNWKVALITIGVVVILILPHLLIRQTNSFAFLRHEWVETWSVKHLFSSDFNTSDGHYRYLFFNLIYVFFNLVHPAFCFLGIILFGASTWLFIKDKASYPSEKKIILISILLYAFFLAGISFQNLRFLLLSFPLVLILLFPGFNFLFSRINKQMLIVCCIASICLQLGLFWRVFIPFYNDNKTDQQIAQAILKYPNKTIYTFSIDMALRNYGVDNPIVNMMDVKLDTMPIKKEVQLALFNENQFAQEWENMNPMLNWDFLNKKYHLNKLKNLPDNWALYEVR